MSRSAPIQTLTFAAAADLSGKQYLFLLLSAEDTVNIATAAAATTIGVQVGVPPANVGAAVSVAVLGTVELMCGAAIAAGTRVTPNASGKAVAATATQPFFARLLQASGADGDIVEAQLVQGYLPA